MSSGEREHRESGFGVQCRCSRSGSNSDHICSLRGKARFFICTYVHGAPPALHYGRSLNSHLCVRIRVRNDHRDYHWDTSVMISRISSLYLTFTWQLCQPYRTHHDWLLSGEIRAIEQVFISPLIRRLLRRTYHALLLLHNWPLSRISL